MITPESLIQLKAFARQDGLLMGLIWLASMWFTFQSPETSWGPILLFSTPLFIYWRMQSFRDNALDGHISMRRSVAFSCYIFFYASLIFALGQYAYFKWLDNGMFMQLIETSINTMKPIYSQQGIDGKELDLVAKTIKMMKPADLTFMFMMQNLCIGAMISPILSLFCKRK